VTKWQRLIASQFPVISELLRLAKGKALGAEVAVLLIRQARGHGAPEPQLLESSV
jgi:hypothetical protein